MTGLDEFGCDDGIYCDCGGSTYLVYDQGEGLVTYACNDCGAEFGVQHELSDDGQNEEAYGD